MSRDPKEALEFARTFIGKRVYLNYTHPAGSRDAHRGITYPINHGEVEGVVLPNGKKLCGYLMFVDMEIISSAGTCIAVISHPEDDNPELIVMADPKEECSDKEIREAVAFKEEIHDLVITRS